MNAIVISNSQASKHLPLPGVNELPESLHMVR